MLNISTDKTTILDIIIKETITTTTGNTMSTEIIRIIIKIIITMNKINLKSGITMSIPNNGFLLVENLLKELISGPTINLGDALFITLIIMIKLLVLVTMEIAGIALNRFIKNLENILMDNEKFEKKLPSQKFFMI